MAKAHPKHKKAAAKIKVAVAKAKALVEKEMKLARAKIDQTHKAWQRTIKNDPKKAVKIAAGVGLAIGAILGATAVAIARRKKK